jgi:hypothetical protein
MVYFLNSTENKEVDNSVVLVDVQRVTGCDYCLVNTTGLVLGFFLINFEWFEFHIVLRILKLVLEKYLITMFSVHFDFILPI